jgi:peptide-methionine (R)-S-oxide reductase
LLLKNEEIVAVRTQKKTDPPPVPGDSTERHRTSIQK